MIGCQLTRCHCAYDFMILKFLNWFLVFICGFQAKLSPFSYIMDFRITTVKFYYLMSYCFKVLYYIIILNYYNWSFFKLTDTKCDFKGIDSLHVAMQLNLGLSLGPRSNPRHKCSKFHLMNDFKCLDLTFVGFFWFKKKII